MYIIHYSAVMVISSEYISSCANYISSAGLIP